jgi:hypothetical protein
VTLPPTETVTGLGENAVVVKTDAPPTMDTGVPFPPVLGVVGDVIDEYEDPQPEQMRRSAAASATRMDDMEEPPAGRHRNTLAFEDGPNRAQFVDSRSG